MQSPPAIPAARDPSPRSARDALDKVTPSSHAIIVPPAVVQGMPLVPIDAAMAGAATPAVTILKMTPIDPLPFD